MQELPCENSYAISRKQLRDARKEGLPSLSVDLSGQEIPGHGQSQLVRRCRQRTLGAA